MALTREIDREIAAAHKDGRALRLFGQTVLYTVMTLVMLVVLLPLFWMILTALRTKGTAFSLDVLPEMRLVYPSENSFFPAPLDLATLDSDAIVYFEVIDPKATTVEASVEPQREGDQPVRIKLTRAFNATWFGALPARPGAAELVVYVDEKKVDAKLSLPKDENGQYRIQAGLNAPSNAQFLVVREGNEVRARIGGIERARVVSLVSETGGQMRLEPTAEGYWEGAGSLSSGAGFRLHVDRTLETALSEKYTIENFRFILTSEDFRFGHYFFNSMVVATLAGVLTVLICTLAAYAFSVFPFHFREQLFYLLLGSMLVPGMIYMVPQFSITLSLGLMNTYAGMVVPHIANVFGLFLLRQYIMQIPRDLFAAAEIDGATNMQIFRTVVIPVCLPIMITLFLLVFVGQWSNFLWQLIINTGDSQVLTLPVGLQQFKGQNANEWERIMAGACFSIVPISVLFLSLQKYFLQGLTAGSVKE